MLTDDIYQPGSDGGVVYESAPDQVLTRVRGAKVRQIVACNDDEASRYVSRRIEPRWRWPGDPPVFRVASSLVIMRDAEYRNNGVRVGGKWLLSGAAGDRFWSRVLAPLSNDEIAAESRALADSRGDSPIRVRGGSSAVSDKVPFAVDLRNGFNFYHFLTEGLPQLAVIAQVESSAPIHVHMPRLADLKGFIGRFIDTLFPQLTPRIAFTDERTTYDRVRAVYQHRHYLYQVNDPQVGAALAELAEDDPWRDLSLKAQSRGFVAKSTIDDGQVLLAEAARARLAQAGGTDWPEQVLVMRDPNAGARDRPDEKDQRFVRDMTDLGFKVLYMERMSPLEQMSLWASARMIVSPHGAAFAQMFFANPANEVIEIGTPQTQAHRWGDFLQNAHVSRCRYTTIFTECSRVGLSGKAARRIAPPMADGHLGLRFNRKVVEAVARRVASMDEAAA